MKPGGAAYAPAIASIARAMPKADADRWVAPQDLAAVIVFLASDAARAIHGAALPVTGLS